MQIPPLPVVQQVLILESSLQDVLEDSEGKGPGIEQIKLKSPKALWWENEQPGILQKPAFPVNSAGPSPSLSLNFNEGGHGREWNTGDEQTLF